MTYIYKSEKAVYTLANDGKDYLITARSLDPEDHEIKKYYLGELVALDGACTTDIIIIYTYVNDEFKFIDYLYGAAFLPMPDETADYLKGIVYLIERR